MSVAKACCTLPPVSSDYLPQGTTTLTLGDLPVYETSNINANGKTLLICVYDIYGFHPNVQQFADKIASTGYFRVCIPDFFRGNPLQESDLTGDIPAFLDLIEERVSWNRVVKPDLIRVIDYYKNQGVTMFGTYGFCWGGKMSARAVCELAGNVGAAALIHPSMITEKDAEDALAPMLFLPSADEEDMEPFYQKVRDKLGEDNADIHVFGDMFHGFCAARGDWTREGQRKRVDEALEMVHTFMKKHLTH